MVGRCPFVTSEPVGGERDDPPEVVPLGRVLLVIGLALLVVLLTIFVQVDDSSAPPACSPAATCATSSAPALSGTTPDERRP